MFYITSLFWLLSISGLLTIVFNKKFEMVITISMILGTLMLYAFGFINHISYGYYLSWLFVVGFWTTVFYWFVKKDKNSLKLLFGNMFTIGTISFLVLSIFAFVLYRYAGFGNCDEFTHWGPMLKETFRLDGFYTQDASRLIMHKDYPPFFTLLEMMWIGFGGFEFHERYAYIALISFMFSMFMPIFNDLSIKNKKDWFKSLIITIGIVLVGLTIDKTVTASDYAFVYNSIYVDWALALFCTYGLFVTYKESDWGVYQFSYLTITLVTFVLMKQMGLVYYIIVLFFAFIKVWLIDKKLDLKMFAKGVLFLVVIPVAAYVTWKTVVMRYQINGQFQIAELNYRDFFDIIRGNTEYQWKYQAFRNYCSNLLRRPLVLRPFKMTYFVYVVVIDLIVVCASRLKKESFYMAGVYTIGAVGYSIAMLLLYTLAFTIDEAPYLASFDRYMVSYLYAGSTLALLAAFDSFKEIYKQVIVLGVLFLFVEPGTYSHITPRFAVEDEARLKITVIEQFNNGIHFEREKVNGFNLDFDILGYLDGSDEEFERLKTALENNDDLYIIGYDDSIVDYWNRLGFTEYLFNEEFYDIDKTNGLDAKWDAFSFVHYVIMYYTLGV